MLNKIPLYVIYIFLKMKKKYERLSLDVVIYEYFYKVTVNNNIIFII